MIGFLFLSFFRAENAHEFFADFDENVERMRIKGFLYLGLQENLSLLGEKLDNVFQYFSNFPAFE